MTQVNRVDRVPNNLSAVATLPQHTGNGVRSRKAGSPDDHFAIRMASSFRLLSFRISILLIPMQERIFASPNGACDA